MNAKLDYRPCAPRVSACVRPAVAALSVIGFTAMLLAPAPAVLAAEPGPEVLAREIAREPVQVAQYQLLNDPGVIGVRTSRSRQKGLPRLVRDDSANRADGSVASIQLGAKSPTFSKQAQSNQYFSVTESSIDFGPYSSSGTPFSKSFTVENIWSEQGSILFSFYHPGDPFTVANDCSSHTETPLPYGQKCDITVTFEPSGPGLETGYFEIGSNGSYAGVGMIGGYVLPNAKAEFSPNPITPGGMSTLTLTIHNNDPDADLVVPNYESVSSPIPDIKPGYLAQLALGGLQGVLNSEFYSGCAYADAFLEDNVLYFWADVSPNSSCEIGVGVTSSTIGNYSVSSSLDGILVPTCDCPEDLGPVPPTKLHWLGKEIDSIPLHSGSLIVGGPLLSVSSTSIVFPNTPLGIVSDPIKVVITNSGNGPLSFHGIEGVAAPFAVANSCPVLPATLRSGASCDLGLTYLPASLGTHTSTVTVLSDGGVLAISVSGTANSASPTVNLAFDPLSVPAGTPSALQLSVSNPNGAPFESSGFSVSMPSALVVADAPNAINPAAPCAGSIVGPSPGVNSFTVNGLSVPTTGSCAFSVNVTSATPGDYEVSMPAGAIVGSVQGQSNVGSAASNVASLVVTEAPQQVLVASPEAIDFGHVTMFSASPLQTITLTNGGGKPLLFSGPPVVSGPFAVNTATSTPCTSTLAPSPGPGHSCTIDARFAPVALGPASGSIVVASDGGSASVTLAGMGDPATFPATSFSPPSLSFPSQEVGTTSGPAQVLLTNVGGAPLTVGTVSTSGDFGASSSCPHFPSKLAVGASCPITVTFRPAIEGTRMGSVNVSSDAEQGPSQVPLSGVGVSAGVPAVSVSPATAVFATTQAGRISPPIFVDVTNSGRTPLVVSSVGIAGSGFAVDANGCEAPVAAGAGCFLRLLFVPTAAGTHAATLQIFSNAPGSPTLVPLSGTATPAAVARLEASPPSLVFADAAIGVPSAPQVVRLTNAGNAAATVGPVSVSPGVFTQTNLCASLAPNASCDISVVFAPTGEGEQAGTLLVESNAPGSPLVIAISGRATLPLPVIELSTSSIAFPSTVRGIGAQESVTLRNVGRSALTLGTVVGTDEFTVASRCPAVVAPGGSCDLDVRFNPTDVGPRQGRFDVNSDAANGTVGVELSGTGCVMVIRLRQAPELICER